MSKLHKIRLNVNSMFTDPLSLKFVVGMAIAFQIFVILFFSSNIVTPPGNVKIANKTDTGVTISWMTTKPTSANLIISTEKNRVKRTISFILCEFFSFKCLKIPNMIPGPSVNHLVVLKNLSPDTAYYYRIHAAGRFWKEDMSGNILPSLKTTPALTALSLPNPLYSYVFQTDGSIPLANTIVTVEKVDTVNTQQTKSTALTSVTDKSGLWLIDLGNMKNLKDGKPEVIKDGDTLKLTLQPQNGMVKTEIVRFSQKSLMPIIIGKI